MSHFASGLSRHPDAATAVGEVVGAVTDRLTGPPSLAVLFVSGSHISSATAVVDAVDRLAEPEVLIGTTAVGVVGGSEEIEDDAAIALWATTGVTASPIRLESLPGQPPVLAGLPDRLEPGSTLLVVADPATFGVDALLDAVNESFPGVDVVGGLASAPGSVERNRLFLGDRVLDDGAVGVVLEPGVARAIVSQGCRPIGQPWVVTKAERHLVHELGGQPALGRLTAVIEGLSEDDRAIAARGLHIGLVANEQVAQFDQGDFLIRAVLGADRATGALAVGARVEVGQVLQFQVRDAASASDDLERLLADAVGRSALVFTCNGRGSHLFDESDHDAVRVHDLVGDAVSGMFCAGELGPIAERNALHGFTATVVLFQ